MAQAMVGIWGNNLAVRLPRGVVEAVRLRDGERVEIDAEDGVVVIRRAEPRVDLAELFRGKSSEAWRAEYAGSDVWGLDFGREIVPE